jgi:thiamine biosynthesis lipoprotein
MFPETEYTLPTGMSREQFRAMGTTITLLLPEQRRSQGLSLVQDLFEEWEEILSRFRPDSELSRLNKAAGKQAIVSELLFKVLKEALTAAYATEGIYDPSLLTQLNGVGYDRSFDELPEMLPETPYQGVPGGAWRTIHLQDAIHGVRLPSNVQLDFGGIAKGMAVDAAIEALRKANIQPAIVNAGGDLATLGRSPDAKTWFIAVPGKDHTWNLPLQHGAVATSGIARRSWQQGQLKRHHLLDPRTGLPVDNNLWSVTVVAARCIQAEIAAKVAFILGIEEGTTFLQQHHLAGLFVQANGDWKATEDWPEHLMRRLA